MTFSNFKLVSLLTLVLGLMTITAKANTSSECVEESVSIENCLFETTVDAMAGTARVKIANRSNYTCKVYVDGNYQGRVSYDDYEYFRIPSGCRRAYLVWGNGYSEWYDFCVNSGDLHRIYSGY